VSVRPNQIRTSFPPWQSENETFHAFGERRFDFLARNRLPFAACLLLNVDPNSRITPPAFGFAE